MKLHELLAVETNLKGQAGKCRTELTATFEKKRHLFVGKTVNYQPFAENEKPVEEERSEINTHVKKELNWITEKLVPMFDASLRVADANTKARASIVLEDDNETVIAEDVPATALLELEKRLEEVKQMVLVIPTNDPAKNFQYDSDLGCYKSREEVKPRTKKTVEVLTLVQPTKEHPGQAQAINVDKEVGRIVQQDFSSMLTVVEKADMLDRVEVLIRATKRARAKANEQEVNRSLKFGESLLDYIFLGKK